MFPALVAAKLNVMRGADDSCIADAIAMAEMWMCSNPVGSGVAGSSDACKIGGPLYERLDDYNNGRLCEPSREQCPDEENGGYVDDVKEKHKD